MGKSNNFLFRNSTFMVMTREGVGAIELMCGMEICEDYWELVDYIDETDPIDDMYILVPMYDWGETCPSCKINQIDDLCDGGSTSDNIGCLNCGFRPSWSFANYKWQQGKPKENSKQLVQDMLNREMDF